MLILLPPSEGKTAPDSGPRLDLAGLLGADHLTQPRREVMEALVRLGAGPQAARVLGLGARSAAHAEFNLALDGAPCAPAWALYTGVLYDAAAMRELGEDPATAAILARSVVVFSGLWGAVRATDLLPDHRLSMGVSLAGLGRLAGYWKPLLGEVMDSVLAGRDAAATSSAYPHQLVIDCRSGAYSPVWQPTSTQASGGLVTLRVRVESLRADGSRQVVSHHAKHTRGLLTGALVRGLATGAVPDVSNRTGAEAAADVANVARALPGVGTVELGEPDRAGRRDLTLVLTG